MKASYKFLAILAIVTLTSAISVRAQDGPPPPSDGQYAQPDQGAPQGPPPDQGDQGDQGASFQTFYDQLGDQGTWVQTDDYGYVFQPNVTDPNWAPYTDGHWVYTDVGWTWVSDEPWGWATYHYGRWANIDGTGWVWVPGYRWAPAWVSWRYGGGYCGWAPLPPETFIGAEYGDPGVAVGIGFHFGGDVDVNFNIGPGCYNFVHVGDMGYHNYHGHYLDRSRNFTVINNTTNITNINVNKTVINNGGTSTSFRSVSAGGPPINEVNAHSRAHVQAVNLVAANQAGRSTLQGNSLSVFAPSVNPASVHQARPSRVSQTLAHPTFNRGDSITKPLAVTSSLQPAAPSEAAIQAAQTAQLHAPDKARIATEKTTIRTPLDKPITSLAPVTQFHKTTNATTSGAPGFNGANSVNSNPQHPSASSAFTGEPVQHTQTYHPQNEVTPQTEVQHTQTYHPQNEVTPQTQVQHTQTYHPQNEVTPQTQVQHTQTYHPQNEVTPQTQVQHTQTYHPQNEVTPQTEVQHTQTYHPQNEVTPQTQVQHTQTYHPQNEVTPQTQVQHTQTYHPQNEVTPQTQVQHTQTYHPQNENSDGQAFHQQQQQQQSFHPQAQVNHETAPQTHTQPAPANSNGNKNDKNKQQQQGQ